MEDLTIIMLTANKVPTGWAEYHAEKLKEAVGTTFIIVMCREHCCQLGVNILDTEPQGISNIYRQMLIGAKFATTPYIAIVEDDTLYPKEHFEFRPPDDAFGYNMNRLNVFTWSRKPTYFWKDRVSNSVLVAPRELTVEALTERFEKHPNGTHSRLTGELGRNNIEDKLGLTRRKMVKFWSETSVVRLDHDFGLDQSSRHHTKKMGPIKAYDIPYWGKAKHLVERFK